MTLNYFLGQWCITDRISIALFFFYPHRLFILVIFSGRTRTRTSHRSASLTVTPYLRAIPCRVSLSVTRCSMNFSPREAVTLAVLPYERILVRARLWDSSLSDSEPDLDRGKMGWPSRPPPSRIGRTGENSAIFSWINKNPTPSICLTVRLFRCCRARLGFSRRGDSHPRAFIQYGGREKKRHDRGGGTTTSQLAFAKDPLRRWRKHVQASTGITIIQFPVSHSK